MADNVGFNRVGEVLVGFLVVGRIDRLGTQWRYTPLDGANDERAPERVRIARVASRRRAIEQALKGDDDGA